VQVRRLIAIAAIERGGKRPTQIFISCQRQQKGTRKLSVGQPQGVAGIAALDREHIHKHWPGTIEKNIQRRCIFEDPAFAQQLGAEFERQLSRSYPLSRRPFPGIRGKENTWMLEQ
jgi:hypothetical protein